MQAGTRVLATAKTRRSQKKKLPLQFQRGRRLIYFIFTKLSERCCNTKSVEMQVIALQKARTTLHENAFLQTTIIECKIFNAE